MDSSAILSSELRDIPYPFLLEAMTPFLNPAALEELVVIAFHLRNVRGGKGERQLFRDMMAILYDYDRGLVRFLLPLMPQYGYWKDVFYLSMTLPNIIESVMNLCAKQIVEDEYRMRLGFKPSLMAKYIPKEKKKYRGFAKSFARYLYPEIDCHSLRMAKARKRISALNSGTLEVKMCANTWASIEPGSIPAVALKKYELALLNRKGDGSIRYATEDREACRERMEEFLNRSKTYKEPIVLTTASEEYEPVRAAVKQWLERSGLNAVA